MSSAHFNGADLGIRQEWLPLFDRYGVDLVVAGHEHHFERSFPVRGVLSGSNLLTPAPQSSDTARMDTSLGTVHMIIGGGGHSSPTPVADFDMPHDGVLITSIGPGSPQVQHPSIDDNRTGAVVGLPRPADAVRVRVVRLRPARAGRNDLDHGHPLRRGARVARLLAARHVRHAQAARRHLKRSLARYCRHSHSALRNQLASRTAADEGDPAAGPAPDLVLADAAFDEEGGAGSVGGNAGSSRCALVAAEPEEPAGTALVPSGNLFRMVACPISPFQECQPAPLVKARVEALVVSPAARRDLRGWQPRRAAGVDDVEGVDGGSRAPPRRPARCPSGAQLSCAVTIGLVEVGALRASRIRRVVPAFLSRTTIQIVRPQCRAEV